MFSVSNVDSTRWFKSSRSAGNGACVEVAFLSGAVAVRDSKHPTGPVLGFEGNAWRNFIEAVRTGEYDLPTG
jgi:hypothetical protein